MVDLEFRTCLFHPKTLATSWSGHIHMQTPLGDSSILVGLCSFCRKWEKRQLNMNGSAIAKQDSECEGCYGRYTGLLR